MLASEVVELRPKLSLVLYLTVFSVLTWYSLPKMGDVAVDQSVPSAQSDHIHSLRKQQKQTEAPVRRSAWTGWVRPDLWKGSLLW